MDFKLNSYYGQVFNEQEQDILTDDDEINEISIPNLREL